MEFDNISRVILYPLAQELKRHYGVAILAGERESIDDWLRAGVIDLLDAQPGLRVATEKEVDIVAETKEERWGIDIKTISTGYRYGDVTPLKGKPKSITQKVEGVSRDLKKMQRNGFDHSIVLFLVYPLRENHREWPRHLRKISTNMEQVDKSVFEFANKIPGVLYLGEAQSL